MKNIYTLGDINRTYMYEYTLFRLSVGGYIVDKRYDKGNGNAEGHKVYVTNSTDNDGTRRAINFTIVKRLLQKKFIAFSHRVGNSEIYVPTKLFKDHCFDDVAPVIKKTKYPDDYRKLIR